MNEFDALDKELEEKQATKLKEKSKKLAEKYLLENQDLSKDLENRMEKSLPDVDSTVIPTPINVKITSRVKLTSDEKIKIAEEKKKLKLEEKLKSQQEKKAMKEAEKTKKLEAKSKK